MELSNKKGELTCADFRVWFQFRFIVCLKLEGMKTYEILTREGLISIIVPEGNSLLHILAIDCIRKMEN